ncbi:zinc finger protein 180 isoform 2-T3 [Dama dama]
MLRQLQIPVLCSARVPGATQLRISGPCLCLEESMEKQDEKPQGPLKVCVQDSLLPQEIIIKVEGEDAGSLAVPSQEEEGTLSSAQRTLDRDVILENHRDSWGIEDLFEKSP